MIERRKADSDKAHRIEGERNGPFAQTRECGQRTISWPRRFMADRILYALIVLITAAAAVALLVLHWNA